MKLSVRRYARAIATFTLGCSLNISPAVANGWNLRDAAAPYRGTSIDVVFLLRPGYFALEAMVPEFEEQTGIAVNITNIPYETALAEQVRDFVSTQRNDVALVDLVWLGTFVEGGWLAPIDRFIGDPALSDPRLNLEGFFPLLLEAFGEWGGVQYGLPFDNYSGLLFYNSCHLADAGFDHPPKPGTNCAMSTDLRLPKTTDTHLPCNPPGPRPNPPTVLRDFSGPLAGVS